MSCLNSAGKCETYLGVCVPASLVKLFDLKCKWSEVYRKIYLDYFLNLETPKLLEPFSSKLFFVGLTGVSLGDLQICSSLKFSRDFDWHHLEAIEEDLLWNGGGFAGHSSPAFLNWILNIPEEKILLKNFLRTFFSLFWGTDDKTLNGFRKTFWFLSGRAIIEKEIWAERFIKSFDGSKTFLSLFSAHHHLRYFRPSHRRYLHSLMFSCQKPETIINKN